MRNSRRNCARIISLLLIIALSPVTSADDIAVRGGTVYPVTGTPITNGIVVIQNGKITAIGAAGDVSIPEGMQVLDAAVVTPGLIDAHSVVGMVGYLSQAHDQDQLERSESMQPELRAIDAYNAREPLIDWLRTFGITTIHTGHGPGEIISGQTLIAKTTGNTISQSVINPAAMVAATLGEGAVMSGRDGRKSPGTRGKVAAMLRGELTKARAYADSCCRRRR